MPDCKAVFYSGSLPADSGGTLIKQGLQKPLSEAGLHLIVSSTIDDTPEQIMRQEQDDLVRCAEDDTIAGLVVMLRGGTQNISLLQDVHRSGKPIVLLGRDISTEAQRVEQVDCDFVSPNDFDSAYRAVTYLVEQGHQSIAHITNNEPVSTVHERLEGYRQALIAAGLPVRSELVIAHETDQAGRIQVSKKLLGTLLTLPDPPTAVFAVHDWVALNVLLTAHLMGLRIPRDLAILGFDSIARFRQGPPLLTSCEQPFEEMGRRAAHMILDRLGGKVANMKRYVYLDSPLKVYESTDGSRSLDAASDVLTRSGAWRARLVYHFIRTCADEELTLEHLANVARVSARRLLEDFQQYEQTSPMQALQEERLHRVHWELQEATSGMTVGDVASRWGFSHLGRFAALYSKKYGEKPSDTLQR